MLWNKERNPADSYLSISCRCDTNSVCWVNRSGTILPRALAAPRSQSPQLSGAKSSERQQKPRYWFQPIDKRLEGKMREIP